MWSSDSTPIHHNPPKIIRRSRFEKSSTIESRRPPPLGNLPGGGWKTYPYCGPLTYCIGCICCLCLCVINGKGNKRQGQQRQVYIDPSWNTYSALENSWVISRRIPLRLLRLSWRNKLQTYSRCYTTFPSRATKSVKLSVQLQLNLVCICKGLVGLMIYARTKQHEISFQAAMNLHTNKADLTIMARIVKKKELWICD